MQTTRIDETLSAAVERADVPGGVAMATTRSEIVYQGAFGRRALLSETPTPSRARARRLSEGFLVTRVTWADASFVPE